MLNKKERGHLWMMGLTALVEQRKPPYVVFDGKRRIDPTDFRFNVPALANNGDTVSVRVGLRLTAYDWKWGDVLIRPRPDGNEILFCPDWLEIPGAWVSPEKELCAARRALEQSDSFDNRLWVEHAAMRLACSLADNYDDAPTKTEPGKEEVER